MNDLLYDYINRWYKDYDKITNSQFYVQFHITKICKNRCKHCYFNEIKSNGEQLYTSFNLIKKVVDDIINIASSKKIKPVIDFTGGDPLLHPELEKILWYCSSVGISIGLKCCSSEINKNMVMTFKKYNVERVFLSLEGLSEINDLIRGKKDFDQTIEAISLLKNAGLYIRIKMTISSLNKNQIEPLMLFLINNRFIVDSFMWARYWSEDLNNMMITKKEFLEIMEKQLNFLEYLYSNSNFFIKQLDFFRPRVLYDFKEHLWYPFLLSKGYISSEVDSMLRLNKYSICCTIPKNVFIIDTNGDLLKCRKMSESNIGNVFQNEFAILLNSVEHRNICNFLKNSECQYCQYINACGGCRAFARSIKGNSFNKDPHCIY